MQKKKQGEKAKETKSNLGKLNLIEGKNMIHLQRNHVVWKLTLSNYFENTTSLSIYFMLAIILMGLSNSLLMKITCQFLYQQNGREPHSNEQ